MFLLPFIREKRLVHCWICPAFHPFAMGLSADRFTSSWRLHILIGRFCSLQDAVEAHALPFRSPPGWRRTHVGTFYPRGHRGHPPLMTNTNLRAVTAQNALSIGVRDHVVFPRVMRMRV